MASLGDLVSSRMTSEVVQKLAGLAGLSATDTKRALDAIVPTQFDGLAAMGSTEAGARRLLAILQEYQGTESFAPVLLTGEAMERQAKVGDTLQTAIHGSELSHRIGSLASSIGIPQGAAASLMGMVMPVVVGLLGREVRERGLDAVGLINLLRGERQPIARDIPAERVDRLDRRLALEASRLVEAPLPVLTPARARLWPWLLPLLALAALGLWYVNRPASTTTSLVGTRWHWARTLFRDGSERRTENAAAYVLGFQRDNNLVVQADCNTGTGKYALDGPAFSLGTLTSSQTACPEASLSKVFLQQLQSSGPGRRLSDGKLIINLKYDAGTMEFVPAR
jgi:heat shock protein HslJ